MRNNLKNKKTVKKSNRGITLIALVVTIIVLLILAGISIMMLTGDNGILTRAGEAKEKTEDAQLEEQVKLATLSAITNGRGNITDTSLKNELKKNVNGLSDSNITGNDKYGWTVKVEDKGYYIAPNGDVNEASWVENSDGTIDRLDGVVKGIKIGDKINETSTRTVDGKTFDGQWRVLGVENGQLLLVSANYVDFQGSLGPEGTPLIQLQGSNGIDNEVERLNTLSAKFADGAKTEKGRSIKVEDINKITGYDPTDSRLDSTDLTKRGVFGKDQIYQYGNNATYTIKAGVNNSGKNVVWYKGDKAAEKESSNTKFIPYGESSDITSPFTIQSTAYSYFPETLGSFPGSVVASGQTMEGISTSSPAYDMLFKPQSNIPYWLASPCVIADSGGASWGLFIVTPPGMVTGGNLWGSSGGSGSDSGGVRPAVSLKSNITPSLVTEGNATTPAVYEI